MSPHRFPFRVPQALPVCSVSIAARIACGAVATWACCVLPSSTVCGQGGVSALSGRPFVIGIIPVVGPNGAVGGVTVDADGVLDRAAADQLGELQRARAAAGRDTPAELNRSSAMRKVSLRGIEAALRKHVLAQTPLPDEVLYLGGLQRVEYVFVYPQQNDIVLAGPADGWRVDAQGAVVGRNSGQPVLQLGDLIVALRAAEADGIRCSIDPTEEGMRRLQQFSQSPRASVTPRAVKQMEQLLGPQQVSVGGVPQSSRFARVMVAADFMMKRLGMGLEAAPDNVLPSYMALLQRQRAAPPKNISPRWWMAAHYDSLTHDEQGLAWRLSGPGVRTLTEDALLSDEGVLHETGQSHPAAARWAQMMTERFPTLAQKMPVFAELRNCMDLAVAAALIADKDLTGAAGCELPLLTNFKSPVRPAEYPVPKQVASRASLVKSGRQWIVSVSGGVQIDVWSVIDKASADPRLAAVRTRSASRDATRWCWD